MIYRDLFERNTAVAVHKFRHVLLIVSLLLIFTGALVCCTLSLITSDDAFFVVIGALCGAIVCWCLGCFGLRLSCQAMRQQARCANKRNRFASGESGASTMSKKAALIAEYNATLKAELDLEKAVHDVEGTPPLRPKSACHAISFTKEEDQTIPAEVSSPCETSTTHTTITSTAGQHHPKSILKHGPPRHTIM